MSEKNEETIIDKDIVITRIPLPNHILKGDGVTYNTVVHRRNMQLNAPPNRRKPGEPLVPPKERISVERFERPWNW